MVWYSECIVEVWFKYDVTAVLFYCSGHFQDSSRQVDRGEGKTYAAKPCADRREWESREKIISIQFRVDCVGTLLLIFLAGVEYSPASDPTFYTIYLSTFECTGFCHRVINN